MQFIQKHSRWFYGFVGIQVCLAFIFNWRNIVCLGADNAYLISLLIPIFITGLFFLIAFGLSFIHNDRASSLIKSIFVKDKAPLIFLAIMIAALLISSSAFFITADLIEIDIHPKILPFALMAFLLGWETLILLASSREELRGKEIFWIGLPLILAGNYYLRHTLEMSGFYLEPFLLKVYRQEAYYVFNNYTWWQLLLPIKEFMGMWQFELVLIYFLEQIIGTAGVWYLFQGILIVTAFFLSWDIFHSKIFSYVLIICLSFSTHNYHAYQYSGVAGFYLLHVYFIVILFLAYRYIKQREKYWGYLAAMVPVLILTAISYEGWMDFFASLWGIAIFLFFYFKKHGRKQHLRRAGSVFALVNVIAAVYLYIKFTYLDFAHSSGESAMLFFYGRDYIWQGIEAFISNYFTNLYMTLSNFLPPELVTSNALYHYFDPTVSEHSLTSGHYVFYWRYFAGAFAVLFFIFFFNTLKRVFKGELFSKDFPLMIFLIMTAINGATHTLLQFLPMRSMPVLGYYVQQGVLGLSLTIAYLLHIFNQKTQNKKIVTLVIVGVVFIILYSAIRRPNYLWRMLEVVEIDHQGPYPNPFYVLLTKIRDVFPGLLT